MNGDSWCKNQMLYWKIFLPRKLRRRTYAVATFSNFLAPLSSRSTHEHSHYAHNIPFNVWWKLIFAISARVCRPGALTIRTAEGKKSESDIPNHPNSPLAHRGGAVSILLCVFALLLGAHAKLTLYAHSFVRHGRGGCWMYFICSALCSRHL